MKYLVTFIDGSDKAKAKAIEEQVEAVWAEITPEGATFYAYGAMGREVVAHYGKAHLVRVIELSARQE